MGAEGDLRARIPVVQWKTGAAATVVCAAKGYPNSYPKGLPITGIEAANKVNGVKVYHAGTKYEGGSDKTSGGYAAETKQDEAGHVTSGGRVLAVTGVGNDFRQAIEFA